MQCVCTTVVHKIADAKKHTMKSFFLLLICLCFLNDRKRKRKRMSPAGMTSQRVCQSEKADVHGRMTRYELQKKQTMVSKLPLLQISTTSKVAMECLNLYASCKY